MRWNVMNVLSFVILMLIPYQVNRVTSVTCHLSVPTHTPKMLVSLKILTIFVVVKLISILFTWPQVLMNFICILAMIIRVNFSFTKLGVSLSFSVIRHRKEIYQSNPWDCNSTTVSPLCEWPCWTLGLLVSVNDLTQFRGNFSFVENTYRVILGLFDCQQSDITFIQCLQGTLIFSKHFCCRLSVRHEFWQGLN